MSIAAAGDGVRMTLDELRGLARRKLRAVGLSSDHADAVAETMVAGERDGCTSHGIYRLLVAASSISRGVVVPDAVPVASEPAKGVVRVDGGGGFAQLAFERGLPLLVQKAREPFLHVCMIARPAECFGAPNDVGLQSRCYLAPIVEQCGT